MIGWKTVTPLGRWLLGLAAALLLALGIGGVLLWNAWQASATAKTEVKLGKNQTTAALESGADAVETVGAVGASADAGDIITRENERAIREAPGADAPVDPAVRAAGLASLCRRAAYRKRPECLQQPPAE